jgi:hypothetical protein
MKKFYIFTGTEQQGPFDISELKIKNIKRETPIWYEGLSDWTTAGKIEELNDIFSTTTPPPFEPRTPPPPPIQEQELPEQKVKLQAPKKKKHTRWVILIVFIIVVAIIAAIVVSNIQGTKNNSRQSNTTYQEKVMTVEEIEKSKPTEFLTVRGTYQENFWGDKINVDCTITNNATVATYKDVRVRVIYYSKTKTVLGNKDLTVYEFFPPHSTKTTSLKVDNYQNVNSIGLTIIDATAY